jgi:hypothetical protein
MKSITGGRRKATGDSPVANETKNVANTPAVRDTCTIQRAQAKFLDALGHGLSATGAANVAGGSRRSFYNWRTADPEFAKAWDLAVESGTDILEDEAWRRAVKGNVEPVVSLGKIVYGKNGEPLTVTKTSDTIMALLLKGRRREKFSEKVSQEIKLDATVATDDKRAARDIVTERLAQLSERVAKDEPTVN